MRPALLSLAWLLVACGAQMAQDDVQAEVFSVPTGRSGEFYIVDTVRHLCFFHTMVGWRGAITPVDCAALPEARPYLGGDKGQAAASSADYGDDEWKAFPEAWVEATCTRLRGEALDLDALLTRHGLEATRYHAMLDLASRDPAYWDDLNRDARARCATPAPPSP